MARAYNPRVARAAGAFCLLLTLVLPANAEDQEELQPVVGFQVGFPNPLDFISWSGPALTVSQIPVMAGRMAQFSLAGQTQLQTAFAWPPRANMFAQNLNALWYQSLLPAPVHAANPPDHLYLALQASGRYQYNFVRTFAEEADGHWKTSGSLSLGADFSTRQPVLRVRDGWQASLGGEFGWYDFIGTTLSTRYWRLEGQVRGYLGLLRRDFLSCYLGSRTLTNFQTAADYLPWAERQAAAQAFRGGGQAYVDSFYRDAASVKLFQNLDLRFSLPKLLGPDISPGWILFLDCGKALYLDGAGNGEPPHWSTGLALWLRLYDLDLVLNFGWNLTERRFFFSPMMIHF